jgi:cytochrome P450
MGMIFGGFVNTGMVCASFHYMIPFILFILIPHYSASWVLVYLGTTDAWKDRATAEVQSLIAAHTDTVSSEPIHRRLSAIPISAWEDEMPVTESIIRETLRIVGNPTVFRRNLSDDFRICGKTVDKGAFMMYNLGDVHLNERFYSNPLKFDPGRFNVTVEDSNAPFLAWGTGRHPCTGQLYYALSLNSSHREIRDEICQIGDQNDPSTRSLPL